MMSIFPIIKSGLERDSVELWRLDVHNGFVVGWGEGELPLILAAMCNREAILWESPC